MITVNIKENSWLALLAAKKLHVDKVAIVVNQTIYLHNCSKVDFLNNRKWLLHELKHVQQYQQLGTVRFIFSYLYESMVKGYKHNRFEMEARIAEQEEALLSRYNIVTT